eukprot:jgi/Mesvir1/28308/Mv04828-RA.1
MKSVKMRLQIADLADCLVAGSEVFSPETRTPVLAYAARTLAAALSRLQQGGSAGSSGTGPGRARPPVRFPPHHINKLLSALLADGTLAAVGPNPFLPRQASTPLALERPSSSFYGLESYRSAPAAPTRRTSLSQRFLHRPTSRADTGPVSRRGGGGGSEGSAVAEAAELSEAASQCLSLLSTLPGMLPLLSEQMTLRLSGGGGRGGGGPGGGRKAAVPQPRLA